MFRWSGAPTRRGRCAVGRSLLVLTGGVLAFVLVAAVGIVVVTSDAPERPRGVPRADRAVADAAAEVAAARPFPQAATPPALYPPSPAPAARAQAPVAAELRDPWDTVPILGRSRTGLGRSLEAAVAELQPEVARCFDPAVHARYAPRGFTPYRGQDGTGDVDEASLMLELEAGAEGLRIVGAPVESRGRLDDDTLACAQHVVQGTAIPVGGAAPGKRFKVRLPITR